MSISKHRMHMQVFHWINFLFYTETAAYKAALTAKQGEQMLWRLTSKWENTIPTITSDVPMVSKMGLFHKSCYEQIKSNGVYAFTQTECHYYFSLSLYSSVFAKSRKVSTLFYEWTPVTCSVWILPPRIRRQFEQSNCTWFRNRTVV